MLENFYVRVVRDNDANEVHGFNNFQEALNFLNDTSHAQMVNAQDLLWAAEQYDTQENNYSFVF